MFFQQIILFSVKITLWTLWKYGWFWCNFSLFTSKPTMIFVSILLKDYNLSCFHTKTRCQQDWNDFLSPRVHKSFFWWKKNVFRIFQKKVIKTMDDFQWHVFSTNFLLWCHNHTLDILKIWMIFCDMFFQQFLLFGIIISLLTSKPHYDFCKYSLIGL